jgi:hypothetical protein
VGADIARFGMDIGVTLERYAAIPNRIDEEGLDGTGGRELASLARKQRVDRHAALQKR